MSGTPDTAPLRVLHRDDHVLVVDKPAGLLTIPGRGEQGASVRELVRADFPKALPVHRLDRGTSGVLVLALGPEAHRALSLVFEGRRAEKLYLALARGDFVAPVRCDTPLAEGRKGQMRVASPGEARALPSLTDFAPRERFGTATWVEARPTTGRTHQIRVHLAALGFPLLLDDRYGDGREVRAKELHAAAADPERVVLTRTPLHAAAIRLPHPSGKGWLQVESPVPPDLSAALSLLRAARRQNR